MLKILFFIFAISIIFSSCNNNNNTLNEKVLSDTTESNLLFYEIDNEILVNEIRIYMDTVEYDVKEKIVVAHISHSKDTTIYTINFANSAYFLATNPDVFFSKISEKVVCFRYGWNTDIKLSVSVAWKYLKNTFPEQYNKYHKDSIVIAPNIREISLMLKFVDKKLVDKFFTWDGETPYNWDEENNAH